MDKKYRRIAELIKRRIGHGEYPDGRIPGIRTLGKELNISFVTVRQALHTLLHEGIIRSRSNRTFEVVPKKSSSYNNLKCAVLLPAGETVSFSVGAISNVVSRHNGMLHYFYYRHYDDETILSTIAGDFDLVFYFINPQKISSLFLDILKKNRSKVVSLIFDYREHGIRLLKEADIEESIKILIDLLKSCNHHRIDLLAIAQDNEIISRRVELFEKYADMSGITHTTIRRIVPEFSFEFATAAKVTTELYGRGMIPDAIFSPTVPAAMAIQRTLKNLGYTTGKDCSLVSCEDLEFASNNIPSITSTYTPDISPLIEKLLKKRKTDNFDTLLFQPAHPHLFAGESVKRQSSKSKNDKSVPPLNS